MVDKLNIKVAWVTPVVGVNGKLLYWERLFKEFSGIFNEFRVFTLEFKGEFNIPNIFLERCGTYKRLYKDEKTFKNKKESYVTGISISQPYVINRLNKYNPDLIITSEFGLLTLYALIYSRLLKKTPVLLLVEAKPKFVDSFFVSVLRKLFRRIILKLVNAIITNSRDGANYLLDEFNVDINNIIIKPYLISNIQSKTFSKTKENGEKIRFIYVGRLSKPKGLEYAILAFEKLLLKYKNQFVFEIVGDGHEKKNLIKQVNDAGLTSHINFHGQKDYTDLIDFYSNADVFVFPSLGDYRALVTFEAISVGLAIIGSKYDGAASESVHEGENGYVIDPRNIDEFSDRLTRFMNNSEMLEKFSKASLEINKIILMKIHALQYMTLVN